MHWNGVPVGVCAAVNKHRKTSNKRRVSIKRRGVFVKCSNKRRGRLLEVLRQNSYELSKNTTRANWTCTSRNRTQLGLVQNSSLCVRFT